MEDIRRRKRKMTREKSGWGEMNHERLWTVGNNLWVLEGRKWVYG